MRDMMTIIVPVYKIKEEFLRNCIESLLNQGREDYKIILVDDGSPDNCGVICDEYADKYSIVTTIHQENQGVSVARNVALEVTDTKWVTFVDADDWVETDYITSLYEKLNGNASDAAVVMYEHSRTYRDYQSCESMGISSGYLDREMLEVVSKATFYKLLINGKFNRYSVIAIWSKVYQTDFLRENNICFLPEAKKGQDRLFSADVLNSTTKIYYFPKLLYHYRCLEESRTNRYDVNIPQLVKIEIERLQAIIEKHNLQDTANEYLKCRICTRLYTCMRLCYFHDSYAGTLCLKLSEVRKLVKEEPYHSALKSVNLKLLSLPEKMFVGCIKAKLYGVLYILVRVKYKRTRQKLN